MENGYKIRACMHNNKNDQRLQEIFSMSILSKRGSLISSIDIFKGAGIVLKLFINYKKINVNPVQVL